MTHNLTHTGKEADRISGVDRTESIIFPEQKSPETAGYQRFPSLQSVGKDRETCPYRNSTIINGPDSSANARNTYNIQHFYCVFHSGTFCVTTYLPTDREKSRDSGFYAPESLGSYQPTCFSTRSLSFSAAISAFIWGSSPPAAAHSPL